MSSRPGVDWIAERSFEAMGYLLQGRGDEAVAAVRRLAVRSPGGWDLWVASCGWATIVATVAKQNLATVRIGAFVEVSDRDAPMDLEKLEAAEAAVAFVAAVGNGDLQGARLLWHADDEAASTALACTLLRMATSTVAAGESS